MPAEFRYALIEINSKPVLVDKKSFQDAKQALRDGVNRITTVVGDALTNGFALQTPDGMAPIVLGTANDFVDWVTTKLAPTPAFTLADEIAKLPEPLKTGLAALSNVKVVLYSASLFYAAKVEAPANPAKLYGELVIGFRIPTDLLKDFPIELREIVLAVNNYPAVAPPTT